MNILELENLFHSTWIQFEHIYHGDIPPKTKVVNTETYNGTCGLVIPVKGSARYVVDGYEYILKRGIVLHAGNAMPLDKEVISDENWEYYLIHFCCLSQSKLTSMHFALQYEEIRTIELLHYIVKYNESMNSPNSSKLLIQAKLFEIIDQILTLASDFTAGYRIDVVHAVCQYMDENYAKIHKIEELRNVVNRSYHEIAEEFQLALAMTPKQYLMLRRIEKAKELLMDSTNRINEIAIAVGYSDPLYFSRIFKRYTSMSPKEYRQN